MTMIHVRREKEGSLHIMQVNPLLIETVVSPTIAYKGDANAVISMTSGADLYVIEPRDVVFALVGNAAMDKKLNPGYYHAVQGVGENEWLIRRADYATE